MQVWSLLSLLLLSTHSIVGTTGIEEQRLSLRGNAADIKKEFQRRRRTQRIRGRDRPRRPRIGGKFIRGGDDDKEEDSGRPRRPFFGKNRPSRPLLGDKLDLPNIPALDSAIGSQNTTFCENQPESALCNLGDDVLDQFCVDNEESVLCSNDDREILEVILLQLLCEARPELDFCTGEEFSLEEVFVVQYCKVNFDAAICNGEMPGIAEILNGACEYNPELPFCGAFDPAEQIKKRMCEMNAESELCQSDSPAITALVTWICDQGDPASPVCTGAVTDFEVNDIMGTISKYCEDHADARICQAP